MSVSDNTRTKRIGWGAVLGMLLCLQAGAANAEPSAAAATSLNPGHAVALGYHRFGEGRHPSTNIGLEQFEEHLRILKEGGYAVRPLADIVADMKAGRPLGDRTVAITVDDAYLSVYTEAWPRLKEAGFSFTLFVATDAVDQGLKGYMSWAQIREMAEAGVTIGSQTASHLHMPGAEERRNRDELDKANMRIEQETGVHPTLFAYPFGETDLNTINVVQNHGFTAAFGQHSGVMHPSLGYFYLPRFAMNEAYGDTPRFKLAIEALPIPATDFTPADPKIGGTNPPAMGFTVMEPVSGLDRLSCYASHEGRVSVERLGTFRFEIRASKPFPTGRVRINCTAPAGDGRWRWLGRQFVVPASGG